MVKANHADSADRKLDEIYRSFGIEVLPGAGHKIKIGLATAEDPKVRELIEKAHQLQRNVERKVIEQLKAGSRLPASGITN